MHKYKEFQQVRIIKDTCSHAISLGTIVTIEEIQKPVKGRNFQEMSIGEYQGRYITSRDIEPYTQKIERNPKEKFLITDPCYIMDNEQYDEIGESKKGFEGHDFPFQSTHKETKEIIIFHKIETTPYGDGAYTFNNQEIGVDSGMLCLAENQKGWTKEQFGATFLTLPETKDIFQHILLKF